MKFIQTITLFVFAFAFIAICSVASAQTLKEGQAMDKVVAIVGSEMIMKSEVDGQVALFMQQDPKAVDDPALRKRILDALIDEKLVLIRAIEDTIEISDEEITQSWEQQLQRLVERYGSVSRIEQLYGMPLSKIQNEVKDDIRKMLLTQKMRQKQFGEISVSKREVDEFYRTYKDSLPMIPSKIELYHIVKNVVAGKNAKSAVYDLAMRIRDSIIKGGDFADFAKRYSADPGSSSNGGDLGWIEKGRLYKEYEQAAFNLPSGQISKPIETLFGYHLIQTLNKNKDSVYTRHILFRTGRNTEEIDSAKNFLAGLKTRVDKGESFETLAKTYSDEKESQGFGGLIGKFSPESIPANIKEIIDKMPEGSVSDPLLYTGEPTQSFHLVYKKRIIPQHKADPAEDYKELENLATNWKTNKLNREWIADLRTTVYWEIKD